MFQAFVATAREACELFLVVLTMIAAVRRAGQPELARWIGAGVLAGVALAGGVLAILPPSGMDPWLDIGLTFGFGLSLALVSCGSMASVSTIDRHATDLLERWLAHPAVGIGLLAVAALSALREALELLLLIRFIAEQTPLQDVARGVGLGLAACALLAAAWRALVAHRATHWVFRLSAVAVFVLGAQMAIEAMAEVLLRGVAGARMAGLGQSLGPYLEDGDRYWQLNLLLAAVPLLLWARTWWRRAGVF